MISRNLKFYQQPDYEYLRNLFYKLFLKNNFKKIIFMIGILKQKNYKIISNLVFF